MGWLSDQWEDFTDEISETWDDLKDGDIGSILEDAFEGVLNFWTVGYYGKTVDAIQGLGDYPMPESSMSDRKRMTRAPANHRSIVYGEARVGSQVVYLESSGADDEYLHIIVVFAAHACKRIMDVYFNDEIAVRVSSLSGPDQREWFIPGKFIDHLDYRFEHGEQTGANPDVVAMTPDNWTTAHKLMGQTYAYFRLKYSETVYDKGLPSITVRLEGKNDIRILDGAGGYSIGYTDNQALCVLDYLRWDRGFDVDDANIDMASFRRAQLVADEQIGDESWGGFFGSGGERRYTANGAMKLNTTPTANLKSLLKAGASTLSYSQGVWSITPGAFSEPVGHYDESDLIGGLTFTPGAGKGERINTAKGTYISAMHDYEPTDFVPISVPAYFERDGEELTADMSLAFTNSSTMARRIGKIAIEQSRYGVAVNVTLKHYAIERKIGQRITLSIATLGWVRKVFRIEKLSFSLSSGVTLALREDAAALYTWEEGENLAVPVPPAVSLPNPYLVTPPTSLDIVESTYQDTNGDTRVRANFHYAPGGASTGAYDVEYKLQSASEWTRAYSGWTDIVAQISDLPPGAYTFRVRGINGIGIKSAWASINHTFEGIENYWPLPVADLSLQELTDTPPSPRAQFSTIRCTITPPVDPLFSHALIEYQLDGSASWTVAGPTDAQERRDIVVLTDGAGYRVRAFSVSTTGIVSATPVVRSIGVSDIDNPSDLPTIAPLNAVIGLGVEGGGTQFSGAVAKIIWQDPNRGSLYVREYAVEIRTTGGQVLRSVTTAVPEYSYTAEANAEDFERLSGAEGTNREFVVAVKVIGRLDDDTRTHESPEATALIENPAPGLPTNLMVAPGYELIKVDFDKPTDLDYTETRIWLGTVTGFVPDDSNLAAVTYGGPVTIAGLVVDADYFIRVATYDAYGAGPMSAELAVHTTGLGLGPWATITDADRAFIEEHLADAAIPGTKIDKITAGQIITGTLGATETIAAGDPLTKPYTVTLGGKAFPEGVALFSVTQNASGDPITALFEDGAFQLNSNANVFPDGGFVFGSQDGTGDYIEFDGTRIIIQTPEFSVDASGNATFTGNLSANSLTTPNLTIDSLGNLTHDNFELNADGSATFGGNLAAAGGTFTGSLVTPLLTIASNGDFIAEESFSLFLNSIPYITFGFLGLQTVSLKVEGILQVEGPSGLYYDVAERIDAHNDAISALEAADLPQDGAVYSYLSATRNYSGSTSNALSVGYEGAIGGLPGIYRIMSILHSEYDVSQGNGSQQLLLLRLS